MTVRLDSAKTIELFPKRTLSIDYGYAVDGSQSVRADRILAISDRLSHRALQGISQKAELSLYTSNAVSSPRDRKPHERNELRGASSAGVIDRAS